MLLANLRGFITGADMGIGRAIALEMVREGVDLYITDLDAGAAQRVAEEAQALRPEARILAGQLDVRSAADVAARIEDAANRLGGLDLAANNAGVSSMAKVEIVEVLKQSSYVEMPEGRVVMLDDEHEMVSAGFANTTPWHAPRDIPDEELGSFINTMASRLHAPERAIFNIHVPPYATGLDTAPPLDDNLKPVVAGGKSQQGRLGARLCARQSSNISRWFRYTGMFTSRAEWPNWVERRALILEANMGTAICVLRW